MVLFQLDMGEVFAAAVVLWRLPVFIKLFNLDCGVSQYALKVRKRTTSRIKVF